MTFVAFLPLLGTQTRERGKYKWWMSREERLEKLEGCVGFGKGDLKAG